MFTSSFRLFSFGCLLVAIACALVTPSQSLQAGVPARVHPSTGLQKKQAVPPYHWFNHTEWGSELWTGNYKPYQVTRSQIEIALVARPEYSKILLAKYATVAEAHPASSLAQFRWAYISLRLAPTPRFQGEDGLDAVRDGFAHPPSPHTYDYTRLRFLLHEHALADNKLIGLGARLLKHQPNDFPVQYYYLESLRNSSSPMDRQTALVEVNHLIQQQPTKASLYALKGSLYLAKWAGDKTTHQPRQVDGDFCIAAYQQYLDRAPANDTFRKSAEDVIHWVQTR